MPSTRTRRARFLRALHTRILEPLEPRTLMTVDFSGTFASTPAAALSGTSQSITLSIANNGTTRYTGPLTLAFYAQLDGTAFDTHTATLLLATSRAANIASLGTQSFTISLPVGASLAAGNYDFYAVLDPAGKVAETDESNNVATSPVVGVVQPNYDLTGSFGARAALVPAIVSGVAKNASLPITITNGAGSSVTIPAGVTIAVQVVARLTSAVDTSQDIVLNRGPLNVAIGGLAHGKSKNATANIQFPANMSQGTYDIILKVDTGNGLAETNETNNEATFAHTVTDAGPFSDPAVTFGPNVTIPTSVVADNRALPLTIDITNEGNVTIPAGTTGSLAIVAHGLSDTTLKTFTVALGGIGPGKMKAFNFSPTILASLTDGSYQIEAVLTTGLPSDDAGNNSATAGGTMTVGPASYNLAAVAPTTQIAPAILAGTPVPGFVTVGITNLSNTRLPAGQRAGIQLVLRPVGENDALNDIAVGGTSVGIGGLGMHATQTFHIGVTIPATLRNGNPVPLGNYTLVSIVTPVNLAETTAVDNTALGDPITIANAFSDLAISTANTTFPLPAAPGTPAVGTVVLRNTGNTRLQSSVTIQYIATPTANVNDGFFIGSSSFNVNLLPGQTSLPLNTALTLTTPANGFIASNYTVYARIDPSTFSDANAGNNQLAAGLLTVSTQHVDLRIASATNPYSGPVQPNQAATAQVVIGNFGSGVSSGMVTINYYITTGNSLDGNAVLIGTQDVMVTLGAAQLTTPINVSLTMTNAPAAATYHLFAQIVASSDVDNNANDNVTTSLGTINYQGT